MRRPRMSLAALVAAAATLVVPARARAQAPEEVPASPASPASPDRKPSWLGVRLSGEVGFGQATLPSVPAFDQPGGRHAALALGWGFEGEGWVRPHLGLGLRLTQGFYAPFDPASLTNSYALVEPQLLWRNQPLLFGPRNLIALSWRASAGVGYASVHTDRACGKNCDVVYVDAQRVSASASTGALLSVGPVGVYLGLRFAFDSSVDWSTALQLALGVEL